MERYCRLACDNSSIILSWESTGLSDELIKSLTTSYKILNHPQYYVCTKASLRFSGDCLKQEKITFNR